MAELTAAAGSGSEANTAGNPTDVAMAYLQDEVTLYVLMFESVSLLKNYNIQPFVSWSLPVSISQLFS